MSEYQLILVTAALQIVAVVLMLLTVYFTRRSILELRRQVEAGYVSQLWMKWGSPEVRNSRFFAQKLMESPDKSKDIYNYYFYQSQFSRDILEVPSFFEHLVSNLLRVGSIKDVTAYENFGSIAAQYWWIFENLIKDFRKGPDKSLYYRAFEDFAIHANEWIGRRLIASVAEHDVTITTRG